MKDLAFKEKENGMYPSMKKGKKHYPHVTLPLSLVEDKNIDLKDEIIVTLKGKITRVEKSDWSEEFAFEATLGETKEDEKKTLANK